MGISTIIHHGTKVKNHLKQIQDEYWFPSIFSGYVRFREDITLPHPPTKKKWKLWVDHFIQFFIPPNGKFPDLGAELRSEIRSVMIVYCFDISWKFWQKHITSTNPQQIQGS